MNIFLHNCYFFPFNLLRFNILHMCFISEYQDDLIVLTNPKLIELITSGPSKSTDSLNLDTAVKSLADIDSPLPHKFEKKHKSISDEKDLVKAKKQKARVGKNRRTVSDEIKDVKILVDDSHDFFNNDSLSITSTKSRRVNAKNKKKNKLTLESSSSTNSKDLIDEKSIVISKPLTVSQLSTHINVPEAEIITYLFLNKSISATVNDLLDLDVVTNIAKNYGFSILEQSQRTEVLDVAPSQNISVAPKINRSPIVTILGHVDHGKTTLLDSILKTNLVYKEDGGITQNISGHEIQWMYKSQERKIVFLDTPGHQSFKSMRMRGAKITDLVLLIIAVDDGIKPQTIEVINYINEMKLSCIIVGTKADKLSSNITKVKQDLLNYNLITEDLGGNIPFIEVSAINGTNIDLLLYKICELSDAKNLYADTQQNGSGHIIESYLDKKQGPVVNIVIQDGILKLGHFIASDNLIGKVKSIFNNGKSRIKFSGPSSIVKVLGFSVLPQAGSRFYSFDNEKDAKKYCKQSSNYSLAGNFNALTKSLNTRITSDTNLDIKNLNLVIKTGNQGYLEAILELFTNISQSKVQINIVHASFGDISNADIELALATRSSIIAFNVNVSSQISRMLKNFEINFKLFSVVYDLFDYVQEMMFDLIEPEYDYVAVGNAIVKTVFKMNKGCVAGCLVNEGKLNRSSYIRVYRSDILQYEGFINSLKHMKNDVEEALVSTECGLMSDFESWQPEDKIEAYKLVKKPKTL